MHVDNIHWTRGISTGEEDEPLLPSERRALLARRSRQSPAPKHLSNWMGRLLADDLPLAFVSMPGTHNSASSSIGSRHPGPVVAAARCQGRDLAGQLAMGVRFFDLRMRPCGVLCHGVVSCGLTIREALEAFSEFLLAHPREVLLARIKDERPTESSALGVDALVRGLAEENCFPLFTDPRFPLFTEARLPSIGEARGKIVLIRDWSLGNFGVAWGSDFMQIQDEYRQKNGKAKWDVVERHLCVACPDADRLHVHFTSATSLPRGVPISIARAVNPRLADHLRSTPIHRFVGIVAMDFPSVQLCELIVQRNLRELDPCRVVHGLAASSLAVHGRIQNLQCECMAAATRADAAEMTGEELPCMLRSLASRYLQLTFERVQSERSDHATEECLWELIMSGDDKVSDEPSLIGAPCRLEPERRGRLRRFGSSFFGRCVRA